MSDRFRRTAGCVLLITVPAFIILCFFSVRQNFSACYTARGLTAPAAETIRHLHPDDLINSGGVMELCSLPGIGESIATSVLAERESNGLFVYPEDITSVKGIGQKKLESIRPLLQFDE